MQASPVFLVWTDEERRKALKWWILNILVRVLSDFLGQTGKLSSEDLRGLLTLNRALNFKDNQREQKPSVRGKADVVGLVNTL